MEREGNDSEREDCGLEWENKGLESGAAIQNERIIDWKLRMLDKNESIADKNEMIVNRNEMTAIRNEGVK